jgi:antitoxin ParD1/3/4
MRSDITTLNISLPKKLRVRLERKLKREDYASASEYVRELIRKDLLAQAIEQVDQLLLEGLNSPAEPYDEKWLEGLKAGLNKRPHRRRA